MKLRTVIVEDEFPARNELTYLLEGIKEVELVGEAIDGEEALELIKDKNPDLVLLDIQLPSKSGLEVAQEIQNWSIKPIIIFITAYDQYAIDAFKVNAIDYLLKPYDQERLLETIERAKNNYLTADYEEVEDKLETFLTKLEVSDQFDLKPKIKKLPVETGRERIKLVPYQGLIVLYTKGGDVYAKTYDREYKVGLNLSQLEEKLKDDNFLRIHRSYLINLEEIKEVIPWFKGKYQVVMADQGAMKVPVSRSKVKILKKIFDL
ncbi:LytTR family DNA-binding domain-containing protein [Natroniella sulfidigena]|uniref:LytR/AlgR family response regulator transcription factor n=1 Tax=Natroniella sulfidigena TaxID=723921 RepID=UPI00200A4249|nr:LytTR family DNA-binding domain-containing protein [Natroniella sulfidigena]MCK8816911.1 LytTR family DNA-binding domain-containing protein [Natroniella sulfidigena]